MKVTLPRFVAASDPVVSLVTIPNVEILEVGEDWETSTGVFTFTAEDLQSAIASQDDPGVRTPIIKLGHTDPRFDGQPSIGRIQNLHTDETGMTLLGDFVGVPAWLGQVAASAYPRRSIEGFFGITTRTGNTWDFVLTGVALLGATYPAVDTLEDLANLWGDEPPVLVPAEDVPEVVASCGELIRASLREDAVPKWKTGGPAADSETLEEPMPAAGVRAAVSVEDIRRSYYDTLDSAQYWWWIREVRVDPAELIVDDDDGSLYRVGYTIDSSGVLTFAEAVEVEIEYVDVAAAAAAANRAAVPVSDGQQVAASWGDPKAAGRPDRGDKGGGSPSSTSPAASSGTLTNDEEVGHVKLSEEALTKLGLKPEATEDEINAAILAQAEGAGGGEGDGGTGDGTTTTETTETTTTTETTPGEGDGGTGEGGGDGGATTEGATTTPATTGVTLPEGMALIDQATLDELKQGATAANELVAAAKKKEKDDLLDGAIRAGKFPRSRRAHYEALLAADPEGTKAQIAALAEGIVPTVERGVAAAATGEDGNTQDAYPADWGRTVSAARRGAGNRIKVASD